MNNITIRENIKPGDIGQIIMFHAEYYSERYGWNHEFEAYVAKPLAELVLRNDSREKLWMVDSSGKVEGAIALAKADEETAQLRWFYVSTGLRGMGYGKELIQRLLDFARESGYRKIILWTTSDLHEAISLYKKFGFELDEEVRHFIWGKELTEQKFTLKF